MMERKSALIALDIDPEPKSRNNSRKLGRSGPYEHFLKVLCLVLLGIVFLLAIKYSHRQNHKANKAAEQAQSKLDAVAAETDLGSSPLLDFIQDSVSQESGGASPSPFPSQQVESAASFVSVAKAPSEIPTNNLALDLADNNDSNDDILECEPLWGEQIHDGRCHCTQLPDEPQPNPHHPGWMDRHQELTEIAQNLPEQVDTIFYGDSIMERHPPDLVDALFGQHVAVLGISGDQTQHLLYRLQNGELPPAQKKIENFVISIGTNNLGSQCTARHAIRGLQAIIRYISEQRPSANILLLAVTPRGGVPRRNAASFVLEASKNLFSENIQTINSFLKTSADLDLKDGLFFLDSWNVFVTNQQADDDNNTNDPQNNVDCRHVDQYATENLVSAAKENFGIGRLELKQLHGEALRIEDAILCESYMPDQLHPNLAGYIRWFPFVRLKLQQISSPKSLLVA